MEGHHRNSQQIGQNRTICPFPAIGLFGNGIPHTLSAASHNVKATAMNSNKQPYAIGQLVLYDSELFRIESIDHRFPEVWRIGNNVAFVDMVHSSQCIILQSLLPQRQG